MITKNKPFIIWQYCFMTLLAIFVIVPFWLVVASSLTPESDLTKNGYQLIPQSITFESYRYLLITSSGVLKSYGMSIIISVVGVVSNLTLTTLYAYPLSRSELPGRSFFAFFLFVTMLFNGGLVPTYLVYTNLFHIKDTFWAMVVPGLLLNSFNVIMMRTYITTNIGNEIIEASRIDGANEFTCLFKIVLPLCKPIIGTLGLMTFIGVWNNWTNGIYYIQKRQDLWGIQNYMKSILDSITALQDQIARGYAISTQDVPTVGLRMALAVLALIPVMIVFTLFQRTFVKGLTIGSVKG